MKSVGMDINGVYMNIIYVEFIDNHMVNLFLQDEYVIMFQTMFALNIEIYWKCYDRTDLWQVIGNVILMLLLQHMNNYMMIVLQQYVTVHMELDNNPHSNKFTHEYTLMFLGQ